MFHFPTDYAAEVVHRACPTCGAGSFRKLFVKDAYTYVACVPCGMVYISPIPAQHVLEHSYEQLSEDYFLDERRRAIDDYPQRHARELALLARSAAHGRLLDVGCATGSFLRAVQTVGFTDVSGIDIAGPSIEAARRLGLRAVAGDFEKGVFEPASLDIVTMWNTLEHLPAPQAFVNEAFRVLRPGGTILVSVPNYGSLSVLLLGKRYRYIGLAHLNYFSVRTLTALLSRTGFEVGYTETRSFNPYVVIQDWRGASTATVDLIRETELSKSFKSERAFAPARLAYTLVDLALRAMGRGDSLLAIGRKPAAS